MLIIRARIAEVASYDSLFPSQTVKAQIFVASYWRDADWFTCSLASMRKYCEGFLPPMVCVSLADYHQFAGICRDIWPEAQVKVLDGRGMDRAQLAMLHCDEMCPEADFIFLMGSDCIVGSKWTPGPFFKDGNPVMLYNSYAHLKIHHPATIPWKASTERILGFHHTPIETMRRVPTVATPELYRRVRQHVEAYHKKPFDQVIVENCQRHRDTSETNILGSYAWEYMRDTFHWVNLDEPGAYPRSLIEFPNPVLQMWSRGGLDRPTDLNVPYIGGMTGGKTPRTLIREVLA